MSAFVLLVGPLAIGEARKHVRDQLATILPPQMTADTELLTSELVSNAVRHARQDGKSTIGLNVAVDPRTIRVSVEDGGTGFDATKPIRSPEPDEGGWGLFLVDQMSARWGTDKYPHSVWFEIARVPQA